MRRWLILASTKAFEVQDHIGLDLVYAHIDWRSLDYNAEPWALIPKRIFDLGKLGKIWAGGTATREAAER